MEIDNITYEHRFSNFIEAKNHALKLAGLLKNSMKLIDGNIDVDVGGILANIGSPDMQTIEKYVLKYMTVTADGKDIRLSSDVDINNHFNQHRSHYFKVIIDGVLFHFSDFLPAGLASVKNINL